MTRASAITLRVVVLAAVHLASAVALTGLTWQDRISLDHAPRAVALGVAFAIVGMLPVHVELGRHATSVTLVDAVLVVGLFIVPDARAVALAALAGELAACAVQRQQPLKVFFNAAATLGTVMLAARVFALLAGSGAASPTHPRTWVVTLGAVGVYALASHASTSTVLVLVAGRRFQELFIEAFVPAAAATAVSAGLGLTVVVLFAASPFAPALLLPLGAVAYLAFRSVASHRADHLRFKRLYEASSKTASLGAIDETLATLAGEARVLLGGTVAIAASRGTAGEWHAVQVGESGGRLLDGAAIDAVRRVARGGDRELAVSQLPRALTPPALSARHCIVASAPGELDAVLLVFRDISDDRHEGRVEVLNAFAGHAALAAANARLFEEVEQSLRQQVDLHRQKDEFLAAVSHELRTPLASVLAAAGTLKKFGDRLDAAKRDRLCDAAERNGLRLKQLIDDLLVVAAAEAGSASVSPEPVETGPFLAGIASDSPGIELVVESATPRVVVTDAARLRHAIDALVDNARKFAPGAIELLAAPAPGGGLAISVRDHGPGIRPGDRERAFERFVQLDQSSTRTHGGTGTGLYLCRQLAELLRGVIELEETPGGGCTFTLAIPDDPDRVRSGDDHSPAPVTTAGTPARMKETH